MGSCAAPSAKGDDKFITTDYLQQCRLYEGRKPSLSEEQQEALRARIKEKNSSMENYKKIKWSAVAKEFKVSEPTLMRYIKKLS